MPDFWWIFEKGIESQEFFQIFDFERIFSCVPECLLFKALNCRPEMTSSVRSTRSLLLQLPILLERSAIWAYQSTYGPRPDFWWISEKGIESQEFLEFRF